ncbi:MAG: hypothetical protein J6R04_06955 [Clostridia bacterium]|nr:hypothetical protein [Clostridia bacterium]
MGLFNKQRTEPFSPHARLASRYHSARVNLLIVVALTVLNAILLASGGNSYFLFSVFVPYYTVLMGMLLCGKFPAEFYGEEFESFEFFGNGILIAAIVIAVLMLALYVLCYVMSGKWRGGWLVAALVLMTADTLIMLWLGGFDADALTDLIFHVWVVICLALGVHACYKLKTLPPEPSDDPSDPFTMAGQESPEEDDDV